MNMKKTLTVYAKYFNTKTTKLTKKLQKIVNSCNLTWTEMQLCFEETQQAENSKSKEFISYLPFLESKEKRHKSREKLTYC